MNKCRFISEGYVFLASIDEISKSKRQGQPTSLRNAGVGFMGTRFTTFENNPLFSIVQITR